MADGGFLNLSLIEVKSQTLNYEIETHLNEAKYNLDSFFLIDNNLKKFVPEGLTRTIYIDAHESRKTLIEVENIASALNKLGMKKNDELSVIGGGFLQDLGTCVASLYMRGIKWFFFPTTLAAMGDSCIGGKSSINSGQIKNLLGNFYPPKSIQINLNWTKSLPQLEIVAGISEILKICFASSHETFTKSLGLLDSWFLTSSEIYLKELVELSLESKKYFVEIDEFDVGPRKLLNFGHTFGHAIESATDFKIPHGVAVLIGMIAACEHESSSKNNSTDSLKKICFKLLSSIKYEVIPHLKILRSEQTSNYMRKDKKNDSNSLTLVLPSENGLFIHKEPIELGIEKANKAMYVALEMIVNEIR